MDTCATVGVVDDETIKAYLGRLLSREFLKLI